MTITAFNPHTEVKIIQPHFQSFIILNIFLL